MPFTVCLDCKEQKRNKHKFYLIENILDPLVVIKLRQSYNANKRKLKDRRYSSEN